MPSYPTPSNYVVQPQQHHEKTLIYVLLNKPEQKEKVQQKIVQPPLDKPEVYFIKYRGKPTSPPPPGSLDEATNQNSDDTVVIDSTRQGYHYNRPTTVLKKWH